MTQPLVVIGAGGFGREALDVVEAMVRAGADLELIGVVDDDPSPINTSLLRQRGVRLLGASDVFLADGRDAQFLTAIGDPDARARVSQLWEEAGFTPAQAIHPAAGVGSQVVLGEGSIICAGAQISTNVRIGRHTHVNPNATIGHDSSIGDFVSVNPGAIVSGNVLLGDRAQVGAGAVVLQGIEVGEGAVVGASACVTRDVAAGSVVKGVPAR